MMERKNRQKMDLRKYLRDTFKNRKAPAQKLLRFGFVKNQNDYVYSADLSEGRCRMTVTVTRDSVISAEVVSTNAKVSEEAECRDDCEILLDRINDACFEFAHWEHTAFRSDFARHVIEYVRETYGDELEFLWKRFPQNAIFRRKDNEKWYAALLTVEWKKLNIPVDGTVEILDLKVDPDEISTLVDGEKYLPGYHMNKRCWVTIPLDGSVPLEEIFRRIDESYART